MLSVGDAESFKLCKDTVYQIINKLDVDLIKYNNQRRKEDRAEIQVDYTYIGLVDNFCYDLRVGRRIENAELLENGLEPLMKRVTHAARIWDKVRPGSSVPYIVHLRLTDEAKFLGNLVIVDLLQPEFQKPIVIKPACSIYYSFTQLRKVIVQAVNTHDFSKPFSLDLNSCVLTKLLAEYLVGLGRTIVIMHLNESLYYNIEETLHALRFGQFLQTIQCCTVANKPDIRVEYYRRYLYDAIYQRETEKLEHQQCKENLKSQEEEFIRVTKQLNLQKQRIEKLVVECSNLEQQLSSLNYGRNHHHNQEEKSDKHDIIIVKQEEKDNAGDVPKIDRHGFEQINDLHIISNIIPDTATNEQEETSSPKTPPLSPPTNLEAAWSRYLTSKAAYQALVYEEQLRVLKIELIALMNERNILQSTVLKQKHQSTQQAESSPGHERDATNSKKNKSLKEQEKAKNAPNIRHVVVVGPEEYIDNDTREEDSVFQPTLQSGNNIGLNFEETQQVCDEMNRAFTENIQKHEKKEQHYQLTNLQLKAQLDEAVREAKQYKEWFLEKQEMQKKLEEYDEQSRKVNNEVTILKSQLLQCNREITKYKEQAAMAETRWNEERKLYQQKTDRMQAEYDQLHGYIERLHRYMAEAEGNGSSDKKERHQQDQSKISTQKEQEERNVYTSANIIVLENQQQEQQHDSGEQCIFALKRDDQGQLMYDTDDGEDIIMQSVTSVLLDNEDSFIKEQQPHHSPPTSTTNTPKIYKRTKILAHSQEDHDGYTAKEMADSSSSNQKGGPIDLPERTTNLTATAAITKSMKGSRRRLSDTSSNQTVALQKQSNDHNLANDDDQHIEKNIRQPLKVISENVQGSKKKRKVASKK
ncbi:hypothetical protein BDA99DRAFT_320297 [Phascolomyces articulosus]|uniref:Uncharacterized protein n=1 Tax=Phascolomyces articulosus TaxID=60185 RepID=A0AAD5PGQ8_9FUNG|nr:hypothetical protein BDA99DRAFT_320297 [Phascolomyces articulosus]